MYQKTINLNLAGQNVHTGHTCFDSKTAYSTFFPKKGVASPQVKTESAAAPLIDAKRTQRNAVAAMTALDGYGGLTFATECKVLIYSVQRAVPRLSYTG